MRACNSLLDGARYRYRPTQQALHTSHQAEVMMCGARGAGADKKEMAAASYCEEGGLSLGILPVSGCSLSRTHDVYKRIGGGKRRGGAVPLCGPRLGQPRSLGGMRTSPCAAWRPSRLLVSRLDNCGWGKRSRKPQLPPAACWAVPAATAMIAWQGWSRGASCGRDNN